jgi:uracil-DNA glycosylase family 4
LEDNGSNILLIFEAPGIDEWSKSKPVCSKRMGSAAVKFVNALVSCGKKLTDYDIAEALYCFPGKSSKGTGQKIQKEVILGSKCCQKYLELEILSKNYKKIVCFGKIAQESVSRIFNNFFKLKIHRSFYNRTYFNYNVIMTNHPMNQKSTDLTNFVRNNL